MISSATINELFVNLPVDFAEVNAVLDQVELYARAEGVTDVTQFVLIARELILGVMMREYQSQGSHEIDCVIERMGESGHSIFVAPRRDHPAGAYGRPLTAQLEHSRTGGVTSRAGRLPAAVA